MSSIRPASGASATIGRNTLWSGIDAVAALVAAFLTSIAIARTFGPAKLGYFNFVLWVCGLSASLGSLGIPVTTAKYMAEFFGKDEPGLARSVFFLTLRVQALAGLSIALVASTLVLTLFDPAYRTISLVLVAGIVPQMIAYIPSQANNAAERFYANLPGSLAGMAVYTCGVILSLLLGWDLLGVAASTVACHLTEMALKLRSVVGLVTSVPASPLPGELRRRMFGFSGKNVGLMLLNLIVWERSDVLFLKLLNSDIRQVAFFSLPFSLVEKALLAPQVLAGAIGATVYAEFGRSEQRMFRIAEQALKYVLICSVPLLFGLAALSKGIFALLYGSQYAPAAGVLVIVALLAAAKSTLSPVQALHSAADRLDPLLVVTCVGGAIDIALDILLVPRYGALGAAVANGAAQVYAAAWLWRRASRTWQLKLDAAALSKIVICGAVMAAVVAPLSWIMRASLAVPAGMAIGVAVYLAMLRVCGVFSAEDGARIVRSWPVLRRSKFFTWAARWVIRGEASPDFALTGGRG